jgi:hypothetical protein
MLPRLKLGSVIAALLGGLASLPASAETVIYSLQYTQNFTGATFPSGTVVGTGPDLEFTVCGCRFIYRNSEQPKSS